MASDATKQTISQSLNDLKAEVADRTKSIITGVKIPELESTLLISPTDQVIVETDGGTRRVSLKTIGNVFGGGGGFDLSDYQTKHDITLNTTDKTIAGAINELNSGLTEVGAKVTTLEEKVNENHTELTEKLEETNTQLSNKINRGEGGVITNAMLSQEVKETMTGGSVAVVGEDTILTNNIVDNQVTPCKTTFVRGKFRMTQENVRLGDNSQQTYDESVDTTWFISITGQDTIKVKSCKYLYFYDENKDYIDRLVNTNNEEPFVKDLSKSTALSATQYVRVGIDSSLDNPTILINDIYYNDYEIELINESDDNPDIFKITTDGMNLFDKDDSDIENGYVTRYGTIDTSDGSVLSGFIEVEIGESYVTSATNYCAYYDKYKHFLFQGQRLSLKEVPNCKSIKYIRISGMDDVNTRYFRKAGCQIKDEKTLVGEGANIMQQLLDEQYLINTNSVLKNCKFYPIELSGANTETVSENYFTTSYLPLEYGDYIYSNKLIHAIYFYSENSNYLARLFNVDNINTGDYEILKNVKSFRLCYSNEYRNSAIVTINNENQTMELHDELLANKKEMLKNLLPEFEYIKTNNLLNTIPLIMGKGLNSNGEIIGLEAGICTDYIPTTHNSVVRFTNCVYLCCYDANKEFMGRFTGSAIGLVNGQRTIKFSNYTYNKEGDIAYFRVQFQRNTFDIRHMFLTVDEELVVDLIDYGVKPEYSIFRSGIDFNQAFGYRIPFMTITNKGTIIAGSDIRYNNFGDQSLISIGTARSIDGGKTWTDKVVACPNSGVSDVSRAMDGTILATSNGRVFLLANHWDDGVDNWLTPNTHPDPNWSCKLYRSDDDGRSWQLHQDLSHLLKNNQCAFVGGVGTGIEMSDGKLVFPIQVSLLNDTPYACQSGIIYSSDGGDTWFMSENLVPRRSGECSVVEYPNGTILLNARDDSRNQRAIFVTTDLGVTWQPHDSDGNLDNNCICQGHTYKINHNNQDMILFSNPVKSSRNDVTLKVLVKNQYLTIDTTHIGVSRGYSCLAYDNKNRKLYCVYEIDGNLVFKDLTDLLPQIQMTHNLNFI